jgi:type II restriction enzyme
MLRSIRADKVPNLLVLHYSIDWFVRNLLLVPRFFFSESAIEERKPLTPQARRAGWVGCNILLAQIPPEGKIAMVSEGLPVPESRVRDEFARIRNLAKIPPSVRGWTLDVLKAARCLGKSQFMLKDVYQFEDELRVSHPGNHNIRPKIRQQLQVLRDVGLAEFVGRGEYRLRDPI